MFNICNALDHVRDDKETSNNVKAELFLQRGRIQVLVKNWGYAVTDLLDSKSFNENIPET